MAEADSEKGSFELLTFCQMFFRTTTTSFIAIVGKPKPPGFERSLFLLSEANAMLMLVALLEWNILPFFVLSSSF